MPDGDAMAAIQARIDERNLSNEADLPSIIDFSTDDMSRNTGTLLGQNTGQENSIRYMGLDEPIERAIGVHPRSIGPAMMETMPGFGSINAGVEYVRTTRIALPSDDYLEEFTRFNSSVQSATWNTGGAIEFEALSISVKVPKDVRHILTALAFFEVQSANSAVAVEAMMRIGAGNVSEGPGGWSNETFNVSPAYKTGNSDQWHPVFIRHTRLITGTDDTAVNGVKCNPRVVASASTSGSPSQPGPISNTFVVGDSFRLKSATNLRQGPSLGATVIAVPGTNATGTIIGGPNSADGYRWWQVTIGANSGYIVQDQMVKTTSPANDPARNVKNYARSGWITVIREPI